MAAGCWSALSGWGRRNDKGSSVGAAGALSGNFPSNGETTVETLIGRRMGGGGALPTPHVMTQGVDCVVVYRLDAGLPHPPPVVVCLYTGSQLLSL